MKRTKLLTSLMMCVMCLSFLVVGVWAAAVSVNFNLNAGLKYYPEGVYVELSGQVYRGSSADNLTALTYDSRFTLEPITNYDNSTGEPSGNFPMESWEIGSIPFIPTEKFVKIEVTVVNHSEIAILATPSILVDDNQEISTITNLSVTENKLDVAYIQAGDTAVYELILEVINSAEINNTLNVSFDFENGTVNYDYFVIENNKITGITEKYTEDSPEILVIPAYSEDNSSILTLKGGNMQGYTAGITNVTSSVIVFQEGLTSISQLAFSRNTYIESVIVPESVITIGGFSFYSCTNLTSAKFINVNGWKDAQTNTSYSATDMADYSFAANRLVKNSSILQKS